MELVIDVKIETKSSSYRNVITDFGYFKKITGESNQNISYIRNATKAEFSIKPCYTGISDGLTITLKHSKLDGVDNAKRLLLSLIETMKEDFEVFKINRGVPIDAVSIVVELNLAVCGECGFMSTSFSEFEDHVSKDHGSGGQQSKKTPWGTATPAARSSAQKSPRGAGSAAYNMRSGPQRSMQPAQSNNTRQQSFDSARRPINGAAASTTRFTSAADKRTASLGFAASRYKSTMTGRPGSYGLAAKRSAVGRPAAGTRQSPYAPQQAQDANAYGSIPAGSKRGAPTPGGDAGGMKRARIDQLRATHMEKRKQGSAVSREENLLTRRLRGDLSDAETKATIQQLKNRLTPKEAKLVVQQIQETEKRERLPKQSDYITLQFKILVGALRRKTAGLDLGTSGKLQTVTTIKEETGRILQMYMKGQMGDKVLQSVISKYMDQYRLSPAERNNVQQQMRDECGNVKKRTGAFPNMYQKNVIHFRHIQNALQNKVDQDGSIVIDFDPFKLINSQKATMTIQGRGAQKKMDHGRAPIDPEISASVRMGVESILRRRQANVIPDNVAENMCKKLMAAGVTNSRSETVLRETWQNTIERKRFQDRRDPSKSVKVTIMLTTIVNYIKQQLQEVNVSNEALEAIMDVVKPGPKPSDPEVPTPNIPIFPVLEKPHATERSIDTRLHWMIAEIGFILKKRKQGQMPDQEVQMMIKRIKTGVPPIYFDVVHGRFQETARDIERMAGRPMSNTRNLTCQLQVICTYARHYLMDKLPGGSPLDPAQHRNPFQYIDYDIDEKSQTKKGIQPLMGAQTGRVQRVGGVQPLMGVSTGGAQGFIKDIPSLIDHMDQEATLEEKKRILELREFAKEANIGVASFGVRRVEKIEKDLLQKMPNKFNVGLRNHKQQVENNKGRALTARERLETTIKWILQNIHASDVTSSTSVAKKSTIPPIVRMKGAEVLKREGMKLWNKLKTGNPQLTEITKELTRLREKLTHNEGNVVKKNYNDQIQKLSKKYKLTRLSDSVAASVKFEATFKYVMGDDHPVAKQSLSEAVAKKFYGANANQSPKKAGGANKSPRAKNQNGGANKKQDDVVVINDPVTGKKSSDQRTIILRNKFNYITRQFKQSHINNDKMAEIIALAKTNLYLSCDDEDELFADVRCAWEDNGGDDLTEKRKLSIELELTTKRILQKVEELIEMEGDITVADVKERLTAMMSGRMIDM